MPTLPTWLNYSTIVAVALIVDHAIHRICTAVEKTFPNTKAAADATIVDKDVTAVEQVVTNVMKTVGGAS